MADIAEQVLKEITKEFGEGIVGDGEDIIENAPKIVGISPAINVGLNGGVPKGGMFIFSGKEKVGKAQPLTSTIYTPSGPKYMKDILVGEIVCTPDGGFAKVLGVFPQGKKSIYRIFFSNDDYADCCIDHLWKVKKLGKQFEVLPLHKFKDNLQGKNRLNWSIELPVSCSFLPNKTLVKPYLLGILIGDGSFLHRQIRFTTVESELLKSLKSELGSKYIVKPVSSKETIDYRIIKSDINLSKRHKLLFNLKKLGLYGKLSKDKFIPKDYIYNDYKTRLALIQGLMDTDGTVDKNGNCSFSTSSWRLAVDFKEVVQSLGFLCKIYKKKTICSNKIFNSFTCSIAGENLQILFRLKRKSRLARIRIKNVLRKNIKSVQYLGEMECRCISVDHPEGLYLTDNFTVTHNTTTALSFAKKCQDDGMKVFWLDVEHRLAPKNVAGIRGLNYKKPFFYHIKSAKSKEDGVATILSAQHFLTIGEKILQSVPNCLVVFDSFSMLSEAKEQDDGIGAQTRGGGAKLLAQFCRQMAPVMAINGSIVVGILQVMANTSGYGAPVAEKGGRAVQYQLNGKLKAKSEKPWEDSKGNIIGQTVTWEVAESALGPPGRVVESWIRYGLGVDDLYELLKLAEDMGLIRKSGAWYYVDFLGKEEKDTPKSQGYEKLYQMFVEKPEWVSTLEKLVYSKLGVNQ